MILPVLQTNMSTTPWPSLGDNRNQKPSQNNNRHQSMTVQNPQNNNRLQSSSVQNGNSVKPAKPVPTVQQNIVMTPPNTRTKDINTNHMDATGSKLPPPSSSTNPNVPKTNRPSNLVVSFLMNANTPTTNNRNNVNVNFLNNERTITSGGNISSASSKENHRTMNVKLESSNDSSDGNVSDNELLEFSETLLSKDVNNAAKYVTINLQNTTTTSSKDDKAPLP